MVLTVTLNPLLERRLFFSTVELGNDYRCNEEKFAAGGKGINVSRQLNLLGVSNTALTFLGGNNGKILRSILTDEKINFVAQSVKAETRTADLIIEKNNSRLTTFFGRNSDITKAEAGEFKSKLEKMIQNCSAVVFSGSSPSETTDDIFAFGIELANKLDKVTVLDTYGKHLQKCIDAQPMVIHNNISEIEKSLGLSLRSEKEKIEFIHYLYSKNVKLIYLTDGANPVYAAKFDFIYKVLSPKINVADATGSGDAFVAGIVYGLEEAEVFDQFSKRAAALGALNASKLETCSVTQDELNQSINDVTIETIGKKMKIIDDSPNY